MSKKITKAVVDSAGPEKRDYCLWDCRIKGFGLKVTPRGRKIYILQTRLDGHLRRYTIGRYGSPWTPELARKEATRLLTLVHQGTDPAERKRAARNDITIAELCDNYIAEGCRGMRSDNPARGIKTYPDRKIERFLSRAELERLASAMKSAALRGENPYAIAAIRFLMLTGVRKNETLSLQWNWVDRERGCLRRT